MIFPPEGFRFWAGKMPALPSPQEWWWALKKGVHLFIVCTCPISGLPDGPVWGSSDEPVHGESVSFDPEVSGPKGRMNSYGRLLVGLAYAFWSVCPYRSYDFRQTWGSAEAEHSMNSMAVERRA